MFALIHVPKTAGTSIRSLFAREVTSRGRRLFSIDTLDEAQHFLTMGQARLGYAGVAGHMPVGVHRHMSSPVDYAVFLRNPADRIVSSYYFVRGQPNHPWSADIAAGLSLTAYAAREENQQTWRLADHDFLDAGGYWTGPSGPISRAQLAQAKTHLAGFAFVGLYERLEVDLRVFARQAGARCPPTAPHFYKTDRPAVAELPTAVQEALADATLLDQELYQYALDLRRAWGGPLNPNLAAEFHRQGAASAGP